MNLHSIQYQQVRCSMYWGNGRLIEEGIPARLSWQPLQEVPGSLWLHPDLFDHGMWKNYRPDEQQPLFFTIDQKNAIQTVWVNEYDVKAYVRGWKNVPVFRLNNLQFNLKPISDKQRVSYKKMEAWFIIPGALTISHDEISTEDLLDSFHVPVIDQMIEVIVELLNEDLGDCRIQLYNATLGGTAVTLLKISNCKPLQAESVSEYNTSFKTIYDIISGILVLLIRQNIKPVWQLIRRKEQPENTWMELVYYDDGAPRRNNFSDEEFMKPHHDVVTLYKKSHQLSLSQFTALNRDINHFKDIIATHDVLPRFQKATKLLNRLIGWRGSDIGTWPEKLKEALDDFHISDQEQFYQSDTLFSDYEKPGPWENVTSPLHSLKVLLQARSPRADWFNGKQIKERNELLMQLLTKLIIGTHLGTS